jgi:hypothetical protein
MDEKNDKEAQLEDLDEETRSYIAFLEKIKEAAANPEITRKYGYIIHYDPETDMARLEKVDPEED